MLIFLSIVYIGYVLISQQVIMHKQKNEISKWNTELGKVKMENQKLKDEVTISGKEIYLEKLAREKLGLVKKGEETIIDKKK
ncbi:dihydroorotate dehydrogenase [Clostridiaceae bacterium 14S0207]|nr:dihydroorotate dehydrogenase [Clostridiaceae bacterium 14S0207]